MAFWYVGEIDPSLKLNVNTSISNSSLLKKILSEFLVFLKENNLDRKITSSQDIENFYSKTEWVVLEDTRENFKREPRYIENPSLKELSKEIQLQYPELRLADIYHILPQILGKIYNFLLSEREAINVDYYYILGDYINFIPENKKPLSFDQFAEHISFFEEVIGKTLEHVNKKYADFQFSFTWKIPYSFKEKWEPLDVDNRIFIKKEDDYIAIEWKYNAWYILDKFYHAADDLKIILNILEITGCYRLNDFDKSFWGWSTYPSHKEFSPPDFTHTKLIEHDIGLYISYFKDHLSKFIVSDIFYINFDYFYLLSTKLRQTKLITASNFFWTQRYRFDSQEFLSYWQAIEIMLWSPESNIKNELKAKFELLFPDINPIEDLWKIRNWIVHNGVLTVSKEDLTLVQSVSKSLLLKLITANYK